MVCVFVGVGSIVGGSVGIGSCGVGGIIGGLVVGYGLALGCEMRCVKPFVTREAAYGCGQCLPCRVARRRTWAHRIMLESLDHADNSFVTLTYEKERRDVSPRDLQLWLKRLRKRVAEFPGPDGAYRKIRHYSVGEYGDQSCRPHYHSALFGWPSCSGQGSKIGGVCQCPACSVVRETWGFGHVLVARLELTSAQYIAGYVVKKMTHRDDVRLLGREPEFARMSLRPGIGANALWNVASVMMQYGIENRGDVPVALRFGGREMPLGRYLRKKLRTMCGKDEKAPEGSLQVFANQLQLVRAFAWNNQRSVASVFEEVNRPVALKLAAREKLRGNHEAL